MPECINKMSGELTVTQFADPIENLQNAVNFQRYPRNRSSGVYRPLCRHTMHFYSSILDYPINARIRPLYSATLTSPIIRYHTEQLIFIFESITHCLLCHELNVENSIVFSTRFRSCETSTGVIIIWKLHSSPIDRTRWFLSSIFSLESEESRSK